MDQLHRAINDALSVRIVAAITTHSVQEAARRQHPQASEALILARGISAGCLLATLAKGQSERVRIHIRGSGPVRSVIIDAHGDGRVRACLEHPLNDPKHPAAGLLSAATRSPSIGHAVGANGSLSVVRDLGMKQPYEGTCALQSGEVDEDIAHYLNISEQLPSLLVCDAVLDAAGRVIQSGGVLCQAFPGADDDVVEAYRQHLAGDTLYQFLRQSRSAEDLLRLAAGGHAIDIMGDPRPLHFACSCGPERARSVLSTIGVTELFALSKERETVDVTCNFCHQVTSLTSAQVAALATELMRSQS